MLCIDIKSTTKGLGGGEEGPRIAPKPGYQVLAFVLQEGADDAERVADAHYEDLASAMSFGVELELQHEQAENLWTIEDVLLERYFGEFDEDEGEEE